MATAALHSHTNVQPSTMLQPTIISARSQPRALFVETSSATFGRVLGFRQACPLPRQIGIFLALARSDHIESGHSSLYHWDLVVAVAAQGSLHPKLLSASGRDVRYGSEWKTGLFFLRCWRRCPLRPGVVFRRLSNLQDAF